MAGRSAAVGQVEPLEQLGGAGAGAGPAEVEQRAEEHEVLAAGEVLVDGRVLAGEADRLADALGVLDHVEAADAGVAGVGDEQGGQDADGGRLAGAVGAEHTEDGAASDGEVDALQRLRLAEVLDEALGLDHQVLCHGSSLQGRADSPPTRG